MAPDKRKQGPIHRPTSKDSSAASVRTKPTTHPGNDPESVSSGSATDILTLQRTIGNQAVMRLMRSGALAARTENSAKTQAALQRALVMPADPTYAADPPTDVELKAYATELVNSTRTAYNALIGKKGELVTAFGAANFNAGSLKYKPDALIATALNNLWSYGAADAVGLAAANKAAGNLAATPDQIAAAQTVEREKTVEYFVLENLRRDVARSVGRRMKKSKEAEVVKLRNELAADAIEMGRDEIALKKQGKTESAQDKFGDLALKGLQKQMERHAKKQKQFDGAEKIAKGITTEVAYEIVKNQIDETDPVLVNFMTKNKADYIDKMAKPIRKDMKDFYEEKAGTFVSKLAKYRKQAAEMRSDISPEMWDWSKRSKRKDLAALAAKLQVGPFKKFIDDPAAVGAEVNKQVTTRTSTEVESLKYNIAQDFLTKFNAGNRVRKKNLDHRHSLKDAATNATKNLLLDQGDPDISTKDTMGKTVTKKKSEVVKSASEKVVKETIEGSMNSSLRKIGWLLDKVAPMPGDKGKLELVLKVPIGHTGGYLGFRFTGQFEHGDTDVRKEIDKTKPKDKLVPTNAADPFKVRSELAFVGGVKVPFVFDAGGELGLTYFEGESDRGALRVMDLVSFGYFRRFKESALVPDWAINMMWGMGGITQDKPKKPAQPTVPLPASPGNPPEKPSRNGRSQRVFKPFQDRYAIQLQSYNIRKQKYDDDMLLYNQDQEQYRQAMEQYRADTTLGKKLARSNAAKRNETDAWGEAMQKSFTDKEYIETGFFAAATGEANILPTVAFKGSAKVLGGKRYTKQTMGALTTAKGTKLDDNNKRVKDTDNLKKTTWFGAGERERNIGRNIAGTEIAAEFSIGPFTVAGKTKLYWLLKQSAKTQKELDTIEGAIELKQKEVDDAKLLNPNDPELPTLEQELEALNTEKGKINEDLRLLENQFFSFDLEMSGQSKASNSMLFGGPEMLTAAAMNYAAMAGSQLRSLIMSYTDTYGQRKNKGNVIGGDLAEDSGSALEGLTNAAGVFDPKKATMGHDMATNQEHFTKSFDNNNDMINQQMHSGNLGDQIQHSDHSQYIDSSGHAANAWDKVNQTQMKGGGGLKLLFKFQWKRDLTSKTTDNKRAAIKVELSLEAAKGLTVGGHGMTASMEKTRRLFRIGTARDKTGKWTMMSM